MNAGANPDAFSGDQVAARDNVVRSLVQMYSATNTEERNQLYNSLVEFSQDKLNFIKLVLAVFPENYTLHEKLSVALFFKSYLNNLIIKKELNTVEQKHLFDELISIIFWSDLQQQVLTNLSPCIESLLFYDEANTIESQNLLESMFEQMSANMEAGDESGNHRVVRVFFSLFKVATNVIQDTTQLSDKMKQFNEILCTSAEKMLR